MLQVHKMATIGSMPTLQCLNCNINERSMLQPYPKGKLNHSMHFTCHESSTVRTASLIIRLSHMVAGDPESVGVLAQLATVDDTALSQVLAAQYRGLLPVVVVQTGACTQRMNQVLQQAHLPLPDILSLSHSQPYK